MSKCHIVGNHMLWINYVFMVFFSKPREKPEKDINKEIGAVIRQITASVTFLPLLDCACKYD